MVLLLGLPKDWRSLKNSLTVDDGSKLLCIQKGGTDGGLERREHLLVLSLWWIARESSCCISVPAFSDLDT